MGKQAIPRKKQKNIITSNYFSFTKNIEEANFRVQRVGSNAGKAFLDKNGALSSNYYIVNNSAISDEELVNFINKAEFESLEYTVGPKSLPKGELIKILEQYVNT